MKKNPKVAGLRERDRQTDRQIDRRTDRHRQRQRDREERDKEKERVCMCFADYVMCMQYATFGHLGMHSCMR